MRKLSWVIQVGSEYHHHSPYKREVDWDSTGVIWPQAKEYCQPPEAGRGKEEILPYMLQRKHDTADNLILDLWPPELWKDKFVFILK